MNGDSENYILPKTEEAIQNIISGARAFFLLARFCLYALYFVYALVRVFVYKNYFVLTVSLAAAAFVLALLYFLRYLLGFKFPFAAELALKILWRLASLSLAVFMFKNILDFAAGRDAGTPERVFAFEIIFTLLCLLGWSLALLGDVFNLTVPVWTRQILEGFKSDIEPHALADRSLAKVKEQGKRIIKEQSPKVAFVAAASALAIGITGSLRKLFKEE